MAKGQFDNNGNLHITNVAHYTHMVQIHAIWTFVIINPSFSLYMLKTESLCIVLYE